MKIAHLADLHIGSNQYGITKRQINSRKTNIKLAKETAKEHDIIIVAGDVFDSNIPSPDDVKTWIDMCKIWKNSECKIIACTGNHDKVRKQTQWVEIGNIDLSQSVFDESTDKYLHCESFEFLKIVSLNHFRKSAIKELVQKIPDNLDIIVMHQSAGGFLPSIMKPELDEEDMIELSKKCKYLALGDLHVHKKMKLNSCIVAYPGNIDFLRLCDQTEDFKYISICYDKLKKEITSIESINFIPHQKTNIHSFESEQKTIQLLDNQDFNIFRYDSSNSLEVDNTVKKIISENISDCFYFHKNTKKKIVKSEEDTDIIDPDEVDFIKMVEKDTTLELRDVKIIEDIWKNSKPEFVNEILKQDLQEQIDENKKS